MKKFFTLIATAMIALCAGAQTTYELSIETAGASSFTSEGQTFTIMKGDTYIGSGDKASDQFKTYLKLSRNADFTITLPEGLKIGKVMFRGVANKTDATSYLSKLAGNTYDATTYVFPAKEDKGGEDNSVEHEITLATPAEGTLLFRFGDQQTNVKIFLTEATEEQGEETEGMSWNFTVTSTADWDNLAADTENWSVSGTRATSLKAYNEEPLMANGVELEATTGLLLTGAEEKIRIDKDQRLNLNGRNLSFTIPDLKKGQKVTVVAKSASKDDLTRYLSATNLTETEGFDAAHTVYEEYENTGTVEADGDVTITTNVGGMNIITITVTPAEGGDEPQPEEPAVGYLWDFTVIGSTDWGNITTDDTNWVVGTVETDDGSFERATLQPAVTNEALMANGTELEMTQGLTFTAKAKKIRVDQNVRLSLNGSNIVITTPSLKKGQLVKVTAMSGSSSDLERYLTASNLSETTGFGAPNEEYAPFECTGVVKSNGKVSITTQGTGGIYIFRIEVVGDPELTITGAGWATYVATANVDFSDQEFTAYKVSEIKSDHINMEQVTEAAEGDVVVVKGNEGTYSLTKKEDAAAITGNLLLATTEPIVADGTQFVLANGANGIGFYPVKVDATIPVGKGYIVVTDGSINSLSLGDDANGIESLRQTAPADGVVYNLQGQRVQKPVRGLYIMNGKKVMVK